MRVRGYSELEWLLPGRLGAWTLPVVAEPLSVACVVAKHVKCIMLYREQFYLKSLGRLGKSQLEILDHCENNEQ